MTKGLDIKYKNVLDSYQINTPLRLSHFFAQYYAECRLIPKRESLYYRSIKSLRKTFKTPFKGKSNAFVSQYLCNTEKCANYVYANRGGNRNEASGDGFKYRGAGGFQHTGFNQFYKMSIDLGLDFLENPELLLQDYYSILGACWYWNKNNLNKFADKDNLDAISDIINIGSLTDKVGDANGYDHRKEALKLMKKHFKL